jgi:hypothetical protein
MGRSIDDEDLRVLPLEFFCLALGNFETCIRVTLSFDRPLPSSWY